MRDAFDDSLVLDDPCLEQREGPHGIRRFLGFENSNLKSRLESCLRGILDMPKLMTELLLFIIVVVFNIYSN